MANLIPPDAKKDVVTAYWLRVCTVWFVLIGFGLVVIAILKLPTFVLLQSQLGVYSGAYNEARDKTEAYTQALDEIDAGNQLAALLVDDASAISFSAMIDRLDTIAGADIALNHIQLHQQDGIITGIEVRGIAATRIALSNFSNDLEADENFEEANVPISSLVTERNIPFNIGITPASL